MTVENTQNKMPPLQMGTTNEYPFTFAVLLQDPTAEEALEAIKASVLQADGTEIELVYNTDYTVTLNTDRIGGTLTVNDIRTSSDYITIYRQYAQTQEVDYKDFNSAPAETFEQCFDKLTMLSQQQQEEINRSIKLPVSSDITKLSLPNPVAGRTLKWNESETGLINSDVSIDEIDEFVKSANESAEIAVEKAEEIQGKLDEALEVADTIKDIEIIATLEIGDIGFTQMAINESKGKRRILNGQLIIQEQYVQFTNIIKNSVALNPDLACTESEWQTEVTMSTAGICDKYVIDDEAGTIRLPKYPEYFIGGGIASVVGNGLALGLTSGTINYSLSCVDKSATSGANLYTTGYGTNAGDKTDGGSIDTSGTSYAVGVTTDPTKSGIEAHLNDAELVKGTYFIQVATGAETEDNIINEIELNNPFSLLDYKYSEYELNNISWLRSQGQYNSKAIYPAVYDLLLKIYNGTETKAGVSVKLSTEAFTDYDFVLNTAEETFRLPVKVKLASGKAVVGNGMSLGLTNGDLNLAMGSGHSTSGYVIAGQPGYGNPVGTVTSAGGVTNSKSMGVTTDSTKSGIETSDSDLYLYFYVGETVQNANLINAGRIEEKLVDKVDTNASNFTADGKSSITSFAMPDYSRGVVKALNTVHIAEQNGWLKIGTINTSSAKFYVNEAFIFDEIDNSQSMSQNLLFPIAKGDTYRVAGAYEIKFYPAKGDL